MVYILWSHGLDTSSRNVRRRQELLVEVRLGSHEDRRRLLLVLRVENLVEVHIQALHHSHATCKKLIHPHVIENMDTYNII